MGRTSTKKAKLQQQIDELELKKRNGMMRCIVAIVCFIVLIVLKLTLQGSGVEFVNTVQANGVFFVIALVAAGFAGIGSRDWARARREQAALLQKLHR
ncbi:hypothetical protein [Adlercreutzia murintestinalis]|uniref:hypothetical protein n=1 Tax=Adlercreutzia murintestinalis TaxID=2941325 RepID=UPI00203E670D|nr:hypothetical protein [Adlercreutzia murintestinalis]